MIPVTRTFLPPQSEYLQYLNRAWNNGWVTNNGQNVKDLELKIGDYINNPYVLFCSNGTIALQMALKALGITGEIITTPFSYVATVGSILWEGCTPIFSDINPADLCIDVNLIEEKISDKTSAILATHVYGFPCDIDKLENIASKYNLKVIYDGAHSFGVKYKEKSIFNFGDITTCSFHATKIFHTVEGGMLVAHSRELFEKLSLIRSFGHIGDNHIALGINGKNSEFHAAMGLANLPYLSEIIDERRNISETYDSFLTKILERPKPISETQYNYAYYPILLSSEKELIKLMENLNKAEIGARRYFYPSLNTLPYLNHYSRCAISESISKRILCLPLYFGLTEKDVNKIVNIILRTLG